MNYKDFYPTPDNLIKKMYDKLDKSRVKLILEPSAGKGNIVKWLKDCKYEIRAIEIEPELRAILKEFVSVVGEDFLKFESYSKYDTIFANFPFSEGDKHLLKAIEMTEFDGGQIICLINAETIINPYSNTRKLLVQKLQELNADIEYIEDGFVDAERKTDVKTAMVYIDIPKVHRNDYFENLKSSIFSEQQTFFQEENKIAENNIIKALVNQYNFECQVGVKAINDFNEAMSHISSFSNSKYIRSQYVFLDVSTSDYYDRNYKNSDNVTQDFLETTRYKFWKLLFDRPEISSKMTREIRTDFQNRLDDLRNIEFSLQNIREIQLQLNISFIQNIEKAILKIFDELTYKSSTDNEKNIHYFTGWKTNKAFKITKKSIMSFYGMYDNKFGYWSVSDLRTFLEELNLIFGYLNNGVPMVDVDIYKKLDSAVRQDYTQKIEFQYYTVSVKKKGTAHIEYKDMDLINKLNRFGAMKKGWLPPNYGKTTYNSMEQEAKDVIKEFEGEKTYNQVLENPEIHILQTEKLLLN